LRGVLPADEAAAADFSLERARLLDELLRPFANHAIRLRRVGVACIGAAAYYLGLLQVTLGEWEQSGDQPRADAELARAHAEAAAVDIQINTIGCR
jgi:hypothetical protein